MKLALVLGGGGLKGAYQAGVIAGLMDHHGIEPDVVLGVSVGSINALAVAQRRSSEYMRHRWLNLRKQDIWTEPKWYQWPGRVFGKPGVFDHRPLREMLLREYLSESCYIPCYAGCVDLTTGYFQLPDVSRYPVNDAVDYLWASATMPIWPPVRGKWVDGGIRHVTPLGAVLGLGVTHVIVVTCQYRPATPEPEAPPKNNFQYGLRCLDLVMDQNAIMDIEHTKRINELVGQAERAGVTLRKPDGDPFRYVELAEYHPPEDIGGTLDDAPEILRRRWEIGYQQARRAPFLQPERAE